jgi:mRNA-degrading endonuclease RelE of RelBE toxin-antitoxin system
VFTIRFAESVEDDLKKIQAYYRNQILDSIEEQLAHVAPIWELRVGDYRVFYDVSAAESVLYVRAIRKKPRRTRTENIL